LFKAGEDLVLLGIPEGNCSGFLLAGSFRLLSVRQWSRVFTRRSSLLWMRRFQA